MPCPGFPHPHFRSAPRRGLFLLCLGCVASVSLSAVAAAQTGDAPNIILCMSDDQGWGDTGYNGHRYLQTPNLDRISAEGVTFTRFYAAAAMCSPTRGSCYTGRHPYRYGITFAMKGMLEPSEIPLTTILKQHGYTTGHFGKWHLGTLSAEPGDQKRWGAFARHPARFYCPPWQRDVDICFVTESKVPTWDPLIVPEATRSRQAGPPRQDSASRRAPRYGNDYFVGPGQTVTENTRGDDSRVIMDRVLPFIREAVRGDRPFLAVIWFHAPHSPVVAGEQYRALYADLPEPKQHYYGCLTAMDAQVGRLRRELDQLGVAEETMLWFCSDNGPARQGSPRHVGSAGPLRGYKLSIHEGGIRVPGLMVWPAKVQEPVTVTAPCVTSDYFPTILDALDIPLPADRTYDGTSLLPLISGQTQTREKPIGFLNRDGAEAAWMTQRYKLITGPRGDRLYDIIADPRESENLAADRPRLLEELKGQLQRWKASVTESLARVAGTSG